jgi:hypothetical protein
MAIMYPDEIEGFDEATRGEKDLFRFIKEAARPHGDFICWNRPYLGHLGDGPDFVLYGKDLGLMVIEVRDWDLQDIITVTPQRFTVRISGEEHKKENPDRLAKIYVNAISKRLKKTTLFTKDSLSREKELKIPIGRMVVFPNIQREAYCDKGLQWLIPSERAMFLDDLDPDREILSDPMGNIFKERISDCFPFRFKGFSEEEEKKLTGILKPDTKIDLPARQGEGKDRLRYDNRGLDESQERLALQLGSGHQIIKGPPGSGKTLVLIQRCVYLYKYHPKVKRVLFVCYNIALVSYIRQLLLNKGVNIGEPDIQICHFFELCSKIIKEPVHFENENSEYYEGVTKKTLDKLSEAKDAVEPFDAIFIDEAQDFNERMLEILMALHRPGGDLVVALDSFQDLYKRRRSWKTLGIHAIGRTRNLKQVYRNTQEIFEFSQRFLNDERGDQNQQLALLPPSSSYHGDQPLLRPFPNLEAIEVFLVKDLRAWINRGDYKRSEIAIIYDDKIYGSAQFAYDNRALPMGIFKQLEDAGIPAQWVSQDVGTKESFDVTTDKISLISIHSSKGLDFDLVYLLGVDHINLTDSLRKNLVTLLYVAMTRAKHRLVIPYVRESELIRRMKDCLTNTNPSPKGMVSDG